jgi:hypothetical protein
VAIRYLHHVFDKIKIFERRGIFISKQTIQRVIEHPERTESGYKGRIVVQGTLHGNLILRVIYFIEEEDIVVVTIYPAKRSQYDK